MADRHSGDGWNTVGGLDPRELIRRTSRKLVENEILVPASAVAYYALTALVPFLVVVVTLAAHLAPDIAGDSRRDGWNDRERVSQHARSLSAR